MPVKLICDICKVDLARTPDFRLVCNNCHCDAAHATIKERDKLNDELDRLKAELRQWRTTGFAPGPAPPDGARKLLAMIEQAAGHYSAWRYDQDRVRRHALVEAALVMGLDREAVRAASGLPTLPEEG